MPQIYRPEDIATLLRADGKWPLRPVLPLVDQAIKRGKLQPSISHVYVTASSVYYSGIAIGITWWWRHQLEFNNFGLLA